mmetsp:Transcript_24855/g.24518  ORF Transcript_24855/g.24518 Transcript_24855/m.24518 type:complete len:172 (-) Transcript_24855:26-541(-)
MLIKNFVFGRREDLKALMTSLLVMGFTGALFQVYGNFLTQFIMLSAILITQLNFARKANIEISHGLECFIAVNFLASFFHPIFMWIDILTLFIVLDKFILGFSLKLSGKSLLCGLFLITLNILYFVCLILDLFDTKFQYFIAVSYALIYAYLFTSFLALEYFISTGHIKED